MTRVDTTHFLHWRHLDAALVLAFACLPGHTAINPYGSSPVNDLPDNSESETLWGSAKVASPPLPFSSNQVHTSLVGDHQHTHQRQSAQPIAKSVHSQPEHHSFNLDCWHRVATCQLPSVSLIDSCPSTPVYLPNTSSPLLPTPFLLPQPLPPCLRGILLYLYPTSNLFSFFLPFPHPLSLFTTYH